MLARMVPPALRLLAATLSATLLACGSSIAVPGGGAGGTSGESASTASTTSGTTTLMPGVCGGPEAIPCPADQYCRFNSTTPPCGQWGTEGTCTPRPTGACPPDCPGVCGCDGQFYCSACEAHSSGFDVLPGDSCAVADGAYRAVTMYTDLPRFLILKASPSRGLCFRLYVSILSGGIGISGDGWSVDHAEATFDVADCAVGPGWPPAPLGPYVTASEGGAGNGTLTVGAAGGACAVGIHGTVQFPPGSTSDLPLEAFAADGVTVEGGCP
jgi:hypothetical protein